jgi:hypothetical protein
MKAEIVGESQEKQEWKFPCLGISGRLVVLFTSSCGGVVVSADESYVIGHISNAWNKVKFDLMPPSQKVILQND